MDYKITYPGFRMKAISFTLDDGNLDKDARVIEIVGKHGIKGSFNLCLTNYKDEEREMYRRLYSGYGIANHVFNHPYAFSDGVEYTVTDEPFDPDKSDFEKIYKKPNSDSLYYIHKTRGWRIITTAERYIELTEMTSDRIERIFGYRPSGFVYPFGEMASARIKEYLYSTFRSVRRTGCNPDPEFSLPESFLPWMYNANHLNLLELAKRFDSLPDDRLRLFVFGVHSTDFERFDNYESLTRFAEMYGDREADFWYATIDEIVDYKASLDEVKISRGSIINNSCSDIYLLTGDKRVVLQAGMTLTDENKENYYV